MEEGAGEREASHHHEREISSRVGSSPFAKGGIGTLKRHPVQKHDAVEVNRHRPVSFLVWLENQM